MDRAHDQDMNRIKIPPTVLAMIGGAVLALGGVLVGSQLKDDEAHGNNAGFHGGGPGGFGGPGEPGRGFHGGPGGPGQDFHGGPGGPGGGPGPGAALADPDLRQVLQDVRAAVGKDAAKVSTPIIDKAVKDKKISKAQGDQIKQMIQQRAQGRPPPGPPPGP